MGAVLEELAQFAREMAAGDEQRQAIADELDQMLTTSDQLAAGAEANRHDAQVVRLPTLKRS